MARYVYVNPQGATITYSEKPANWGRLVGKKVVYTGTGTGSGASRADINVMARHAKSPQVKTGGEYEITTEKVPVTEPAKPTPEIPKAKVDIEAAIKGGERTMGALREYYARPPIHETARHRPEIKTREYEPVPTTEMRRYEPDIIIKKKEEAEKFRYPPFVWIETPQGKFLHSRIGGILETEVGKPAGKAVEAWTGLRGAEDIISGGVSALAYPVEIGETVTTAVWRPEEFGEGLRQTFTTEKGIRKFAAGSAILGFLPIKFPFRKPPKISYSFELGQVTKGGLTIKAPSGAGIKFPDIPVVTSKVTTRLGKQEFVSFVKTGLVETKKGYGGIDITRLYGKGPKTGMEISGLVIPKAQRIRGISEIFTAEKITKGKPELGQIPEVSYGKPLRATGVLEALVFSGKKGRFIGFGKSAFITGTGKGLEKIIGAVGFKGLQKGKTIYTAGMALGKTKGKTLKDIFQSIIYIKEKPPSLVLKPKGPLKEIRPFAAVAQDVAKVIEKQVKGIKKGKGIGKVGIRMEPKPFIEAPPTLIEEEQYMTTPRDLGRIVPIAKPTQRLATDVFQEGRLRFVPALKTQLKEEEKVKKGLRAVEAGRIQKAIPKQVPIVAPVLAQRQELLLREKTAQRPGQRQRMAFTPRVPPPRPRFIPIIFTGPPLLFPDIVAKKFRKPKRKIPPIGPVYKPSLLAVIGGITAKEVPKRITGLGIRPIVKRVSKSRRLV